MNQLASKKRVCKWCGNEFANFEYGRSCPTCSTKRSVLKKPFQDFIKVRDDLREALGLERLWV